MPISVCEGKVNKIFSNKILVSVFVLLVSFILVGLAVTGSVTEKIEPTISLTEVDNLSDAEIVHKLFIMLLEHYKAKFYLDDEKITDYKDVEVREVNWINDKTIFSVGYSVQQNIFGDYWQAGNGRFGDDGWKLNKSCYVQLIKENGQARLHIKGTGL